MFKVTVLFLSMFLLFGCGDKTEDEAPPKLSQKEVSESLAEKNNLEEQLKQTKDEASCKEILVKYRQSSKELETSSDLGSTITPPSGNCTAEGWKSKTE